MLDLSIWPKTLWQLADRGVCQHCKRSYSYHGATEAIATKLGFRINQKQLVCRPPEDINSDSIRGETMKGIESLLDFGRTKANP